MGEASKENQKLLEEDQEQAPAEVPGEGTDNKGELNKLPRQLPLPLNQRETTTVVLATKAVRQPPLPLDQREP